MVTKARLPQPENASYPIVVTELGMITEVRPLQPPNADASIDVTVLGMVVF